MGWHPLDKDNTDRSNREFAEDGEDKGKSGENVPKRKTDHAGTVRRNPRNPSGQSHGHRGR